VQRRTWIPSAHYGDHPFPVVDPTSLFRGAAPNVQGRRATSSLQTKTESNLCNVFSEIINIVNITHVGKASLITLVVLSEMLVDSLVSESDSAGDQ